MVKVRPLIGLLVLLLFLCFANSCVGDSGRELVVVFKGDQTEVPYEDDNGTIIMRKPRAFRVPAFVGGVFNGKELLVVLCDARYNGFSDWSFIEGAARTSYGDYRKWGPAEIFAKNTRKSKRNSVVGDVTAVMKGDKIYALTASWDESPTAWFFHKSNAGWQPVMIVGTVMNRTEAEGGGVFVNWDNGTSLRRFLPRKVHDGSGYQFIGGVGNAVVTKKGTIVFPIQISNTVGQYAASIMYSNDEGSTWTMGPITDIKVTEGSVVELESDKLLLIVRYDKGYRKAYEWDFKSTKWKSSPVFTRVWGNELDRSGVGCQGSAIAVPVDGKDVFLFAHPLNKKGRYTRDTLQLWMSDGKRILRIGTISERGKGEKSGYSILGYVGTSLYIVHEINPFGEWKNYHAKLKKWDRVIALSPLQEFFERVKITARVWGQLDTELQKIKVPANELVGFLGDLNDGIVWKDRYNCVNATASGATPVPGGFRFSGEAGSGARWPVRTQGQNQVYKFSEKQFTIAATVIIHAAGETGNETVFGAREDAEGNHVLLGIGYTKEKKWYTLHGNSEKAMTASSLELEKEYHVALTFSGGVGSVYVDGRAISSKKLPSKTAKILYFYMGGIENSSTLNDSSCTVKNVMLFNKALDTTGISNFANAVKNGKLNETMTTVEEKLKEIPGSESYYHWNGEESADGEVSVKEDKSNNAAVVSLSFVAGMCFVYSAIVLMWL